MIGKNKNQLKKEVNSVLYNSIISFATILVVIFTIAIKHDIDTQMIAFNNEFKTEEIKLIQKDQFISNVKIMTKEECLFKINGYHFRSDFTIALNLEPDSNDYHVVFQISHDMLLLFTSVLILGLLIFIIKFRSLSNLLSEDNLRLYLNLQDSEQKLSDNTLSLLSENIHHELKTPLVVISSKINSLKEQFTDIVSETIDYEGDCHRHLDKTILGLNVNESKDNLKVEDVETVKDFDLIETHIGVIYNVLDRMKDYKNIKNDNTNRSIYDLIEISCKTLKLFSKNDFVYSIDPKTKQYMVDNKMRNEDLINIFINHIKNSLEAHSTKVEIHVIKYLRGVVYLQLMDNGNGVPIEAQSKLFNEHFSTKGVNSDTRGIGLYLSKLTLNTFGGDDFLIASSNNGTSFGINIPSYRRG